MHLRPRINCSCTKHNNSTTNNESDEDKNRPPTRDEIEVSCVRSTYDLGPDSVAKAPVLAQPNEASTPNEPKDTTLELDWRTGQWALRLAKKFPQAKRSLTSSKVFRELAAEIKPAHEKLAQDKLEFEAQKRTEMRQMLSTSLSKKELKNLDRAGPPNLAGIDWKEADYACESGMEIYDDPDYPKQINKFPDYQKTFYAHRKPNDLALQAVFLDDSLVNSRLELPGRKKQPSNKAQDQNDAGVTEEEKGESRLKRTMDLLNGEQPSSTVEHWTWQPLGGQSHDIDLHPPKDSASPMRRTTRSGRTRLRPDEAGLDAHHVSEELTQSGRPKRKTKKTERLKAMEEG